MRKGYVYLFILFAWIFCVSALSNAAVNRISGNGYIFPEIQTYKAIFSMDVSRDGANPPSGFAKYYYSRTRMNMVSTAITDMTISGVGTAGSIAGSCNVNNAAGYTFIQQFSVKQIGIDI